MKKNMGPADRIIRISVAVIIAILYFEGLISGTTALILGIVAAIFLITSFISSARCIPFSDYQHVKRRIYDT